MVASCSRPQTRFAVLPPCNAPVSGPFRNVTIDHRQHDELTGQMQRMRGKAYLQDGAIHPDELTSDGRHKQAIDERSWHVLSIDREGRVVGCLRYLCEREAASFDSLWVRHAAVAACPKLGGPFRRAVEARMKRARQMRVGFGEVGGWAVDEEHRWTIEPLRIILATYGLLELLGGSCGVATATFRHGSASILRRIGLFSLTADGEDLPPYYDPYYSCQMEVLGFDSRFPNPKYHEKVAELSATLMSAPVICRERQAVPVRSSFRGLEPPVVTSPLVPALAVA